jgi:hypothetical protein
MILKANRLRSRPEAESETTGSYLNDVMVHYDQAATREGGSTEDEAAQQGRGYPTSDDSVW